MTNETWKEIVDSALAVANDRDYPTAKPETKHTEPAPKRRWWNRRNA